MSIFKTSEAFIVRPSSTELIRLVGYANPEIILPNLIQKYFSEVGYMSMYPYFKTLRIGAVHPFAMMLYQEVSGTQLEINLFPSITIADTSDTEVYDTLGRDSNSVMIDGSDIARLKAEVLNKTILTSDENIVRLENATANGNKINAVVTSFRANHNIDMNIWGDNKDMVSLLYDLLKHFVLSNKNQLRSFGIDIEGAVSGRRSGDVNVEFGKLLYGANVTVPAVINTTSLVVDLPIQEIKNITYDINYVVK